MKRMVGMSAVLFILAMMPGLAACGSGDDPVQPGTETTPPAASDPEPPAGKRLRITAGPVSFSATLSGSPAGRAFAAMLPMRVTMNELNGNEKYTYLPDNLPVDASGSGRVHAGDLMLYGSGCLVLFYKTFPTSYDYTPLGRLDDAAGLETALGTGSVTVEFESGSE